MFKLSMLTVVVLALGCAQESVEEYNKKLKKEKIAATPKSEVVKIETALPGGKQIPCEQMLDATEVAETLGEKDPVTISDQSANDQESTSLCSIRRGGKMMDSKTQEKRLAEGRTLGVLAGDELCSIAVYCSVPADDKLFKDKCKRDKKESNEDIGTLACVSVRQKGPYDAYTYRYIEPDTRCVVRVRGGPSVNEESEVQKCAKAALLSIDQASIGK
ncbi:MAG: hypothetical protein AAGC55_27515 [Myxococcota bacterium]